jgi:hypothetical protein
MLDRFTYGAYRELVGWLGRENANVCFEDFPLGDEVDRIFILRHDVDFSPEAALRMAEFEARIGARASYFVLLTSPHYNLLAKEHSSFPRRLVALGHEVGLHYDVEAFEAIAGSDAFGVLELQIGILSALTGKKVRSIAMHNPSSSGEDPFRGVDGFVNAYADPYVKETAYFSDSCGAWRDDFVRTVKGGEIPARIQLLTHPLLWAEEAADRNARLDLFLAQRSTAIEVEGQQIKAMWARHPAVLQHERRRLDARSRC